MGTEHPGYREQLRGNRQPAVTETALSQPGRLIGPTHGPARRTKILETDQGDFTCPVLAEKIFPFPF
jgi:hypothetical protein